ncbi:hypothetical protein ABW20_dc0108984 [Dactylellina cionopaga]|nr:hypothetical protein ABW20_dc0108984 [Dactylellina cionopaga]
MYRSILFVLLARLAAGQDVTDAPNQTAGVSISDQLEYTLLGRSCIQHCVYYNGPFPRGPYYHDWDDVGGELGCGYGPINGCYCNTNYASSATSYFSSCISEYCGTKDPSDFVSGVSRYNAYCATANGNPTKPLPVAAAPTTPASRSSTTDSPSEGTTTALSPETNSSSPSSTTSVPMSTSGSSSGTAVAEGKQTSGASETTTPSGGGGLSKGATIGIAVGASLGGVVLIGIAVLLLLKKRKASGKESPMGGIEGY